MGLSPLPFQRIREGKADISTTTDNRENIRLVWVVLQNFPLLLLLADDHMTVLCDIVPFQEWRELVATVMQMKAQLLRAFKLISLTTYKKGQKPSQGQIHVRT